MASTAADVAVPGMRSWGGCRGGTDPMEVAFADLDERLGVADDTVAGRPTRVPVDLGVLLRYANPALRA